MRTIEQLGRRFFWIKSTGNIVAQRNEMIEGIESTKEEDFAVYIELKGYNPDAIQMTTFEYGQHTESFMAAKSWRFDPITHEIIFIYPSDPSDPEAPPVFRKSLTEQINENTDYLVDVDYRLSLVELGLN